MKLFWTLSLAALLSTASAAEDTYKIYVEETGAYRVTFEELGLDAPLPSAGLGITHLGIPTPIWIEDGGDGTFGPGDHLEFLGDPPRGTFSRYDEHTRSNVYFLHTSTPSTATGEGFRMRAAELAKAPGPEIKTRRKLYFEEDILSLRLPPEDEAPQELWYWAKLSHQGTKPFIHLFDVNDLAAEGLATIRVGIRGWSRPKPKSAAAEEPHHAAEIWLNDKPLGATTWDGTAPYVLNFDDLPVDRFVEGENSVEVRVQKRTTEFQMKNGRMREDPLIDVIVLNWLEVDYPRSQELHGDQTPFYIEPGEGSISLQTPSDDWVVYSRGGSRWAGTWSGTAAFQPPAGERSFLAADLAQLRTPAAVVPDRPSNLRDTANQADYLMIGHHRLLPAIEPLAEFHRQRGLNVVLVDVEDVYDEWNHGMLHPQALRGFIAYAYESWQKPAPRFVLLVGDASWDGRNSRADDANYADLAQPNFRGGFISNKPTLYADKSELNDRGLVPTNSYTTYDGHAASDNAFVAVDGDDALPDLAIGRLPVVEPEEVALIVEKSIRYASEPAPGDWRRNLLFVTSEQPTYQSRSNRTAMELAKAGYQSQKIYPEATAENNEEHSQRLMEALNEGQLAVHFIGHGGRYIWRTGPPDFSKNHDLFTLDHLDQLAPNDKLPIVLSLTCYSAPFDHPNADSIGEKLLRLDGKGAVAVLAASWRNSPRQTWGQTLLEELTKPGATIGEAVMRAKRSERHTMFVETYNLLGDPALPVALPEVYKNKIKWATASEVDNFGYDVYRAESEDGPWERVTDPAIEGAGTVDEPSYYEFVDTEIDPYKAYYYYVESIALDGTRERFTPVARTKPKLQP